MSDEKVTVKKAVSGIGSFKNFVKLTVHSINIGIVVLVVLGGMSVWNKFFPKKPTQNQTQTSSFVVEQGANVEHLTVLSSQQQEKDKKTVGLEFSASSNDASAMFKKYINDSWYVGAGVRWDYRKVEDEMQAKPEVKLGVDF